MIGAQMQRFIRSKNFNSEDASRARASIEKIHKATEIDISLCELLYYRGIDTEQKAAQFLRPDIKNLHDPMLMHGMDSAVKVIEAHINKKSKIVIYGDYDADGVTSCALLCSYFRARDVDAGFYIPSRHVDGYGMTKQGLDNVKALGAGLIISVDCGITSIEEAKYAKEIGLPIIITDHHQCLEELPECEAIVNPLIGEYPFKKLAGVGVAAKLLMALGGFEAIEPYLDIIAFGTIADIVPLVDENRLFADLGLESMNRKARPGIKALTKVSGIKGKLDSGHVSFMLAPRVNAKGRLGDATIAVELLMAEDDGVAAKIAEELDGDNKRRQKLENEMLQSALELIPKQCNIIKDRVLLICSEGWNHGVAGIVASKLTEIFYRPVILLCQDGEICTGSGRSITGVHLFEALYQFSRLYVRFGGHEQAAGLTIVRDNISNLRDLLNTYLREKYQPDVFIPTMKYDMELGLERVNMAFLEDMERLKPFGMGNATPSFLIKDIRLENPAAVGKEGTHLKTGIRSGKAMMDGIAFGKGNELLKLVPVACDIIVSPEINHWNGMTKPQCVIKGIKQSGYRDSENILSRFSQRFANVLLENFPMEGFKKEKGVVLLDTVDELERKTVQALLRDICGTAVLVYSFEGAKRLLKLLDANKLADRFDISEGVPSSSLGYNCIVIAPSVEDVYRFTDYERLLIYDFAPNEVLAEFGKIKHGPELIVSCEGSGGFVSAAARSANLSREELLSIFFVMKGVAKSNARYLSEESMFADIAKRAKCTHLQSILAYRVFFELGLTEPDVGRGVGLSIKEDGKKTKLEKSRSYCRITELAKSSFEVENGLRSEDP